MDGTGRGWGSGLDGSGHVRTVPDVERETHKGGRRGQAGTLGCCQ